MVPDSIVDVSEGAHVPGSACVKTDLFDPNLPEVLAHIGGSLDEMTFCASSTLQSWISYRVVSTAHLAPVGVPQEQGVHCRLSSTL